MTTQLGTIVSCYQQIPTGHGAVIARRLSGQAPHLTDQAVSAICNEVVDSLTARAVAIAPSYGRKCARNGAIGDRPGDDTPRRQLAWDLVLEAYSWRILVELPDLARETIGRLLAGEDVTLVEHLVDPHDLYGERTWVIAETLTEAPSTPAEAPSTPAAIREVHLASGATAIVGPDGRVTTIVASGSVPNADTGAGETVRRLASGAWALLAPSGRVVAIRPAGA